jgi:hypothetical protein
LILESVHEKRKPRGKLEILFGSRSFASLMHSHRARELANGG